MSNKKEKASFVDQYKMNTPELCEQAIKNGWIAALISVGITLAFSVAGFFAQSENETLNYFLDRWLLIDVLLMTVLAFFIFRKSRIAASLMFVYFVISKLSQWYDLGTAQGLPMALIFIYFYFNAMRGTFIWYSRYKKSSEVAAEI